MIIGIPLMLVWSLIVGVYALRMSRRAS